MSRPLALPLAIFEVETCNGSNTYKFRHSITRDEQLPEALYFSVKVASGERRCRRDIEARRRDRGAAAYTEIPTRITPAKVCKS